METLVCISLDLVPGFFYVDKNALKSEFGFKIKK